MKQLKGLYHENKMRPKQKRKKELVNELRIVLNSNNETTFSSQLKEISDTQHHGPPTHHDIYRSNFNSIDLHDRYWHRFRYYYKTHNWRTKIIMGILTVAVLNSWTLYSESVEIELGVFREIIAVNLLNDVFEWDLNQSITEEETQVD